MESAQGLSKISYYMICNAWGSTFSAGTLDFMGLDLALVRWHDGVSDQKILQDHAEIALTEGIIGLPLKVHKMTMPHMCSRLLSYKGREKRNKEKKADGEQSRSRVASLVPDWSHISVPPGTRRITVGQVGPFSNVQTLVSKREGRDHPRYGKEDRPGPLSHPV